MRLSLSFLTTSQNLHVLEVVLVEDAEARLRLVVVDVAVECAHVAGAEHRLVRVLGRVDAAESAVDARLIVQAHARQQTVGSHRRRLDCCLYLDTDQSVAHKYNARQRERHCESSIVLGLTVVDELRRRVVEQERGEVEPLLLHEQHEASRCRRAVGRGREWPRYAQIQVANVRLIEV